MASLSAETRARNQELIAERLDWPPEALGIVRWIEEQFPGYRAWWGRGWISAPQPGYYATFDDRDNRNETFFGAQAAELVSAIQRDVMRRAEEEAARAQRVWWR